ncbi:MAG: DUF3341 domain-containing protein [Oligoflexia bacterium]|nr:DUF3341 domain-containing protein [Oligoflexia bacterium]
MSERPLIGIIGFFDDPGTLLEATRRVRDARYRDFDVYTPYPVHGLEAAQGLRRSPLPYVTLVAGVLGCLLAFLFQYWTAAVDWPLNVGGKPFNSWPAWVPIMFELTVLFAGLATAGAMFAFNGLPNIRRKAFDPSLTRDRFALVIEAPLPDEEEERASAHRSFDRDEVARLLSELGAIEVRPVYAEGWFGA